MIAPDTNVIVRIITKDDPDQASAAADALRSERLYLCKTVFLELEWVLRYCYGFGRIEVNRALRMLLGLENTVVEDRATITKALVRREAGMDFADALHLSSSSDADTFVTFDRRFVDAAAEQGGQPEVRLLGLDSSHFR